MRNIQVLEGKVVAPEGMRVAIVASRFNEIRRRGGRTGAPWSGRGEYYGGLGAGSI